MPFVVGRRIVLSQDAVLETAMASRLEKLDRREAAAQGSVISERKNVMACLG
ncbi:hypothetical protein [Streptomyces sp. NPDC058307]|uniref:hypothetical protein n=1 Tax=Streptomyces sp. NPDC058307 TaxID=3346439 RepID=UPI0036EFE916